MSADAGASGSTNNVVAATSGVVANAPRLVPGACSPANAVAIAPPPSVPTTSTCTAAVKIRGAPSKYVKLNVGGALFYTTIDTLTKQDNMLRAMFSGRMEVLTDSEGWILIDRSGKHFGIILNYLRDGHIPLPESVQEVEELMAEAKYYLVQSIVEQCNKVLLNKKDEFYPVCRIPVITSQREAQMLISNSAKPVVKLVYNRQNNKYSYTSNSDDNILKNIEMFDKLSVRFNGRVTFVKDVFVNEEICCWSFFGHSRKVAEISCTSIVYTSEKKQTKVEFPEARILEETLNVLLYERHTESESDPAILRQIGSLVAVGTSSCSDEDEDHPRDIRLRKT
ncbi:BTB/POZ domain-containing adapter for CUL3-mediated RhoA degradation protein 3-like [Lytechinus variegatus]|uniref:BTB/POZ domain-containing adapter for CUL3-mediated RhoA degradation protein 3-like n=1 Tax=Lytechinus variegatus TaxID=7654 RepID=UPI001BB2BFA8|nr:BTB/POZ domain-containing adapter for CUL3-mediated RhoA degradation protein 3-like [Lytechinus variegatus]